MHPICLLLYYEPKVHDDQNNGVTVAINEKLGEARVKRYEKVRQG